MIREHIGGMIPFVELSRRRNWDRTRTFRVWIVWFRRSVAIEVEL